MKEESNGFHLLTKLNVMIFFKKIIKKMVGFLLIINSRRNTKYKGNYMERYILFEKLFSVLYVKINPRYSSSSRRGN